MKKSKKLMYLKRVSVCGGCKYSWFKTLDSAFCDESMFCNRHHNKSIFFTDSPCAHYVPFNDVMCPCKTPYWLDDDFMPF